MTIFPLPVIAEHSSSTVMSKVSSFPITAGDSGLVTGQGDDSEINLRNGLRIVQDNARVFRCPEVHSEMNEEDDDSTKQQHKQQRKPTSNKCRWGSESPTKLSPITSRRNSVTNDGDQLLLSVKKEDAFYSGPYQRQRADSSDKLMRRPERRVSVEGFEKLLCYQEEDQQGDEKLTSQNVRWH
eukprot:CAMPEP_0171050528 /NCGR_PEP_ID=MMETSP0736-20130129/52455_1 /TAXON_ID=186038 /ORGANISM="Fragilariopsis kerguelensis, Strain L26-C5" /LENGTH=182 /DNA_ID=CAMNT_0011503319 /DNA_START=43 /DNA_END=587 /DNA_ORIENTATION=-